MKGKAKMKSKNKDRLISELKINEERYRQIAETSIDAVMSSDKNDLFVSWDGGSQPIFGFGPEIIGTPVTTIIPEKYRKAHQDGVRRFIKTGERHIIGKKVELEAVRKDGSEFSIELSLSAWENREGMNFGAIIRDISERKQLEKIREDVQRMIRHDIKSPLIGITGMAKLMLKDGGLTDKQRKAAGIIKELGERTINFLNRSRDLFQMEQGVFRLLPQDVNLTRVLGLINKSLDPLILKKRVNLKLRILGKPAETDYEYLLKGDEGLIEMMLTNLIKNAVEGSPEGADVNITAGIQRGEDRDYHIIDIHNMGAIPDEIRDKFFDAYVTRGKRGGTGLGTYSARLIAGAHQGKINFTTSEEAGTHVTVLLPVDMVTELHG
jgi:PAS domain S-box-containing protein